VVANNWTDSLTPTLRSIVAGLECRRIEEARQGGWNLLLQDGWSHARLSGEHTPLDPLGDTALPDVAPAVARWRAAGQRVELLAWRVGRRAVFRVSTDRGAQVCKFFRKAHSLVERWSAVAPGQGWSVPTLLDWNPAARQLSIAACPGESLNTRWLDGRATDADSRRLVELLGWLAAQPVGGTLPRFRPDDEIDALIRRLDVFERVLSDPPAEARPLVGRVVEALRDDPGRPPVVCHGDLHDKQILIDGPSSYLIDLDRVAAGPPALDPGNLLAHLRLRSLTVPELEWKPVAQRIAATHDPSRPLEDSLHRWTAAALMRLALIYARRPRRTGLLRDLLETTRDALDRDGTWRGIL